MSNDRVLQGIVVATIGILLIVFAYLIGMSAFGWEHSTQNITVLEKQFGGTGACVILADESYGDLHIEKIYYVSSVDTALHLKIGSRYTVATAENKIMRNTPFLGENSAYRNIDYIVS